MEGGVRAAVSDTTSVATVAAVAAVAAVAPVASSPNANLTAIYSTLAFARSPIRHFLDFSNRRRLMDMDSILF